MECDIYAFFSFPVLFRSVLPGERLPAGSALRSSGTCPRKGRGGACIQEFLHPGVPAVPVHGGGMLAVICAAPEKILSNITLNGQNGSNMIHNYSGIFPENANPKQPGQRDSG